MLYGSSVKFSGLVSNQYLDLLDKHFQCWYPDSGFGWEGNSKAARAVVNFAVERGKILRGNCLLSCTTHGWSGEKIASLTDIDIYRHVSSILMNFPEIEHWDCTHEAIADNGSMRRTPWIGILGEDWQEQVFRLARTNSCRDVKLFYCDYFRTNAKFQKAYELIRGWLDKPIPIDGISLQLHANLKPSVTGRYSTLDLGMCEGWISAFKDLGLVVHCPEIVVWQPADGIPSLRSIGNKSDIKKEHIRSLVGSAMMNLKLDIAEMQAETYEKIVDMCERCGVEIAGFWSAFDTYPWNWIGNRSRGGFWDKDYKMKSQKYLGFLPNLVQETTINGG